MLPGMVVYLLVVSSLRRRRPFLFGYVLCGPQQKRNATQRHTYHPTNNCLPFMETIYGFLLYLFAYFYYVRSLLEAAAAD